MNITFQSLHFTADQKLKDYITAKIEKLQKFNELIMDAKVTMKLENSGQVKDKIVEIVIHIPGETFICVEESKTFESSADKAVDALKRQIKRHKEKKLVRKRSH
ncbi:ribosome hibernation-promoting factor, HPF/YfiA family [Portibacter marinus]|uniref:ribosome hibernation-promoting factor, HPF/YfiA family n=1 Tax=Portibacter marinus TaxID=2898660 RepID=UPI001F454E01|nr:ribosome-associated translation inhibitor RaiA [Portibacter marinus]